FVARYKADAVGGLTLDELHSLLDAKQEWEELERRKEQILKDAGDHAQLRDQLGHAWDLDRVEDLFIPHRTKKQTLGVQAREAGLEPFANEIWDEAHAEGEGKGPLPERATAWVKPDTRYADPDGVLKGVMDILVERVAENPDLRAQVRSAVFRRSKLRCTKGTKAKNPSKYSKYFDYQEPIGSLKKSSSLPRYLTIRKGWMEDELAVSFERPDEGPLLEAFEAFACPNRSAPGADLLLQAARLALKGNVYTAVENETHRHLRESSEECVASLAAAALTRKLRRAPLGAKPVLSIVPGAKGQSSYCAFLDGTGKVVFSTSFKPEEVTDQIKGDLAQTMNNVGVEAVVVAHGTGGKAARDLVASVLATSGRAAAVTSVHEPLAGIYSTCPAGKEDFPDAEPGHRKAVFLGRFVQDPLPAVARLDTKFYSLVEQQHEVPSGLLRRKLHRAIESVIADVGADLNLAPLGVLQKVPGLNADQARALIARRENQGPFTALTEIRDIPGLTERAVETASGFLRISPTADPLSSMLLGNSEREALGEALRGLGWVSGPVPESIRETLQQKIGSLCLDRMLRELSQPDPRGAFVPQSFESGPQSLSDLQPATPIRGYVTNITSFGVFVDVGLDQDGLVHLSELPPEAARSPQEYFHAGGPVQVWVVGVNAEKEQISLTMKDPAHRSAERARRRGGGDRKGAPRRPRRPPPAAEAGAVPPPGGEERRRPPRPPR
ncbi:MAG: helix-hairpin-helix domain-containing protein, partial [Bdellovibrionales bacterium]|nr:helix-hairpin-helix domain-containing protein [Bdellovibrionales bacterium]